MNITEIKKVRDGTMPMISFFQDGEYKEIPLEQKTAMLLQGKIAILDKAASLDFSEVPEHLGLYLSLLTGVEYKPVSTADFLLKIAKIITA